MLIVSGRLTWIPLYLFIIFLLIRDRKQEALFLIISVFAAVALTDLASVHLFKNVFMRLRPCHEPDLAGMVNLVGRCGGKFGFVSSHAANSFVIAVLSALYLKRRILTLGLIFWASLVAFSRVYLGVHYPGDIIGGALLGTAIATGIYFSMYHLLLRRRSGNSKEE